jgi:hypothetical protein
MIPIAIPATRMANGEKAEKDRRDRGDEATGFRLERLVQWDAAEYPENVGEAQEERRRRNLANQALGLLGEIAGG